MKKFKLVEKVLLVIIFGVCCILSINSFSFAGSAVKIFDRDGRPQGLDMIEGQLKVYPSGTTTKVIWMDNDTDGTSQQLVLPAGNKCTSVLIQVNNGVNTDYSVDSSCSGFLYSATENGDFVVIPNVGLILSISKQESETDTELGWVKAPTGNKLVIFILY